MAKSLKVNYLFNVLNTATALLFPLIGFSYASRIVQAEGIGIVQFYSSIINYIILLFSLGIPLYGIREIATVRDDEDALSRTTKELIILSTILSCIGYFFVILLFACVGDLRTHAGVFAVLTSLIFLNSIGCSWFFGGIEDFRQIALAGLISRIIALLLLFVFVQEKTDLIPYSIYTVISTAGSNIINFILLRKRINLFGGFKDLNIIRHIKPAIEVFAFNIVTSIYLNLDSVMLGFLGTETAVGYYTASTRISHIMVTIITSFGAVLLPRSSNLVRNAEYQQFYSLTKKSLNVIYLLGFPSMLGILLLAPNLITIFCGNTFYESVTTLRLISPIIIFIGISNLIGLQVLYPLGKIRIVTISTLLGAFINVLLNILLIPHFLQNGAAMATLCAEFGVTIAQCVYAMKYLPFKVFTADFVRYALFACIMFVCGYLTTYLVQSIFYGAILTMFVCITVYILLLILSRDRLTFELIKKANIKRLRI